MNKRARVISLVITLLVIMGLVMSVPPTVASSSEPTSENLLANGDFSNGMDGWGMYMSPWVMGYRSIADGALYWEITDAGRGSSPHEIQASYVDLTIVNGKEYAVYFDAMAAEGSGRPIDVSVSMANQDWSSYSGVHTFDLAAGTMNRYSFTFVMEHETTWDASLVFMLAENADDVVIDNVALYDLTGGSDPAEPDLPTPSTTYDNLAWSDEFDGSEIDTTVWTHEEGGGGWGNNELQVYTSDPENSRVDSGYLIIEAHAEEGNRPGSVEYTSARLNTKDNIHFGPYGRIEMRAKLPYGQGIWPAFWGMGENFDSVGWPGCGEMDIMEMVGATVDEKRNDTRHGVLHWEMENGDHWSHGDDIELAEPAILHDDFHVYGVIWDTEYVFFYMDDVIYHAESISESDKSEFHQPFFLLLNLAIGGEWPGYPDKYTTFPQQYVIDYVRVYDDGSSGGGGDDTTPPAAPSNLTATAVSDSQIDLDWDDNSESDLDSYNVYRDTTSGFTPDSSTLVASGVTSSAYSDTDLSAETTYYYKVTAVDTSGNESDPSNEASATTDGDGGGSSDFSLSVSAYKVRGDKYADLTWSGANSTNVDVYRDGTLIATTANDGAYTDGPLGKGGGSATYQVCEEGTTTCSNEVSVSW